MPLPEAVRKAGEKSEELLQAAMKAGTDPKTQPVAGTEAKPGDNTQAADPKTEGQSPAPDNDADHIWETKFKVLKGKYDSEVPRLHTQVSQLQAEIEKGKAKIAELEAAAKQPSGIHDDNIITGDGDIDIQHIQEEYGPAIAQVIKGLDQRNKSLSATIQTLQRDVSTVKTTTESFVSQASTDASIDFYAELARQVPDWETINVAPEFFAFLSQPDRRSGIPLMDLLKKAHADLRADSAIAIFQDFKKSQGANTQTTQQKPKGNTLDDQLIPEGSGGNEELNTKPSFTRSQVKEFYRKKANGYYKHTKQLQDEAIRIEREIEAAAQAGRIIEGR